jgi:NAD(P)-dependent dehydrogenase (short-subunit alcohol dehydrogenase family)
MVDAEWAVYGSGPLTCEVVACEQLEFMQLDVSSMASVNSFVTAFRSGHERLDVLINNAGVMLKVSHRPLIGTLSAPLAEVFLAEVDARYG